MSVSSDGQLMSAVVKKGQGRRNVVLENVPVPLPGDGTASVEVVATGICGTDVHVADDEYGHEPPVVMGHEVLAVVHSVGEPADEWLIGRRVACETYRSTCGTCAFCRDGRINLCPRRRSIGSYENGGFASRLVVPVTNLHLLPAGVEDIDGVLAEPLACVTQCLLDPPVMSPGDRVLVTGPGAMGQIAAQVARAQGAIVTLAGLDSDRERLAIAEELGFETTTEPHTLERDSFDATLECSGSGDAAASALRLVRRGGCYVQLGIFGRDITVPFDLILYKELTVSSGFASTPASWRRAMALIEQGRVILGPLVTRRVPLSQWESAFQTATAGQGVKTVILPD